MAPHINRCRRPVRSMTIRVKYSFCHIIKQIAGRDSTSFESGNLSFNGIAADRFDAIVKQWDQSLVAVTAKCSEKNMTALHFSNKSQQFVSLFDVVNES